MSRAFILGNSGELLDHDLSRLKGETVFAVNAFPLRYPEIITHYVCLDILMAFVPEIRALVPDSAKKYYSRLIWNTIYEEENVNVYDTHSDNEIGFEISDTKVYGGKTVVYVAMQIAAALGFTDIYLLGVDCGLPANGVAHIPEQDIFYDLLKRKNLANPFTDKRANDVTHEQFSKFVIKNFILARDEMAKHGISVTNLSRGGNLNCFKRKSFNEVMGERGEKLGDQELKTEPDKVDFTDNFAFQTPSPNQLGESI